MRALLVATRRALHAQRLGAAAETTAAILATTPDISQLVRVFAKSQKPELLIQVMWDHREIALRRLSSVATFMGLCGTAELRDAYIPQLRSWLMDDATAPVVFSHHPLLQGIVGVRDERLLDLFLFKYKGWDISSPQKISENVTALAARCEIPQPLATFLFERRVDRNVEFSSWLHDVKSAQVFNHVFKDAGLARFLVPNAKESDRVFLEEFGNGAELANNVDMAQAKLFFEGLDTSRGLVLCIFHGAFSYILRSLCSKFMPEHYAIELEMRVATGDAGVRHGERGAAFRAFKALMKKKAVLMAPDGPEFADSAAAEITVFGLPFRISVGAAVLAYEAGSDTGWCSLVRQNDRFAPVYVPGPMREPGESFEHFRGRWLSFYAKQIEDALSSDPKCLDLRSPKWCTFGIDRAELTEASRMRLARRTSSVVP